MLTKGALIEYSDYTPLLLGLNLIRKTLRSAAAPANRQKSHNLRKKIRIKPAAWERLPTISHFPWNFCWMQRTG